MIVGGGGQNAKFLNCLQNIGVGDMPFWPPLVNYCGGNEVGQNDHFPFVQNSRPGGGVLSENFSSQNSYFPFRAELTTGGGVLSENFSSQNSYFPFRAAELTTGRGGGSTHYLSLGGRKLIFIPAIFQH